MPQLEFTDTTPPDPLPHLRTVLAAVPAGVAPVELATFMTSPQPDLPLGGAAATPRAWLLAGQPAAPICDLLASFYQWRNCPPGRAI